MFTVMFGAEGRSHYGGIVSIALGAMRGEVEKVTGLTPGITHHVLLEKYDLAMQRPIPGWSYHGKYARRKRDVRLKKFLGQG